MHTVAIAKDRRLEPSVSPVRGEDRERGPNNEDAYANRSPPKGRTTAGLSGKVPRRGPPIDNWRRRAWRATIRRSSRESARGPRRRPPRDRRGHAVAEQ